MYCFVCGKENPDWARFCCSCGKEQPTLPTSITDSALPKNKESAASRSTCTNTSLKASSKAKKEISFNEFKKRKTSSRSSFIESKSKKNKNDIVTIQVGLMKFDGKLRPLRGRLPLTVPENATASFILMAAVEKYTAFDKSFVKDREYTLLYPDGAEVVSVPGTTVLFTLSEYKKALGKPYTRIILFICTKKDLLFERLPKQEDLVSESDSDSDVSLPVEDSCTGITKYFEKTTQAKPKNTEKSSREIDSAAGTSGSVGSLLVIEDSLSSEQSASNVQEIQCPICFLPFPIQDIAEHADACNSWQPEFCLDESDLFFVEQQELLAIEEPEALPDNNNDEKSLLMNALQPLSNSIALQEKVRINVRRKFLWDDFKQVRANKIKPQDNIKIVFVGECAIDDGGPKREFFTELLETGKRKLFSQGRPTNSTMALAAHDFQLLGEAMVMSVLQGGPAPNFLEDGLYRYITNQDLIPLMCRNPAFKLTAINLTTCVTDNNVQNTMLQDDILDILQQIGYSGVPQRETTLTCKKVVQSICIKDQLSDCLPQLLQLQEGLKCCNLLTDVKKQPKIWKPVFVPGNTFHLSADEFLDQVMPDYNISQSTRSKEVDTFKYFSDVIMKLDVGIENITMQDFLQWCTGSRDVPPLGFPKQFKASFIHGCAENCRCRPSTSTCDLVIKLPVHIKSEEEMTELMVSAIGDSYGFGNI